MANLKDTVVKGTITGNLTGNADTATSLKTQAIGASTDLNTLVTPGCFTTENATGLTNCPTTQAFYLKVEQISATIIKQTIYTTNEDTTPVIYMRTKVNDNFGNWSRLTGVQIS